jgi:cytochrome c oxidase assembly protein subunit 11
VTPAAAGAYFNKIECFCFTEQTLNPGEKITLPVQYFVDPAILDNPDAAGIKEITLSYTFYPARQKTAAAKTN